MAPSLDISKVEVVLVGAFSPDNAMPSELAKCGAISKQEAESAEFKTLVVGQIVEFSMDWGTVQIFQNRLTVHASKPPYVRVADLALKTVREAMSGSVVTMMGINREFHFRYESAFARDELGKKLSPPSSWGDWGKKIEKDMVLPIDQDKHGGLLSITMRQNGLEDREAGWLDVALGISKLLPLDVGVGIRVNDHYQLHSKKDPDTIDPSRLASDRTGRLMAILLNNFDASIRRSEGIATGIVGI